MVRSNVLMRSGAVLCAALLLVALAGTTRAQSDDGSQAVPVIYRGVSGAVRFDVSPPLRSMKPVAQKPTRPREIPEPASGLEGKLGPQDVDPLVQGDAGPNLIPGPIVSFNGQGNLNSVTPPDPVGDVGPNHYVAMANLTFTIFDKAGNLLFGPANNNTLWAGFGGDCQTDNSGDPIVVYDQMADR